MTAAAIALAVLAVVACAAGYLTLGGLGLVGALSLVAGCVVLAAYQVRASAGLSGAGRRAPARTGPPAEPEPLAGFPQLRRIEAELAWSAADSRRYPDSTRRLLHRLYAAVLAQHHLGMTGADEPAARELVGADIWPYVCAADSGHASGRAPGHAMLVRVVDRLDQL